MKNIQYKDFSLRTHKKNWRKGKPNMCQFELTFSCDFHCLYCYSDCYNNPAHIKKELSTKQIKLILDKVYNAGCLWLCLTGGDPLKRKDFLEIYSYAKEKGFIINLFTNAYSLTEEIADFFKKRPPFAVELTLNAITKKTFEEISQIPGSYEKTMDGINMFVKRKIPLKIKMMLIKKNIKELPRIEKLAKRLGLEFGSSPFIFARLNKDAIPCSLRVSPEEAWNIISKDNLNRKDENCLYDRKNQKLNDCLFRCAVGGGDGVYIDPYGQMVLCSCLREPSVDLLKQDIKDGLFELFPQMSEKTFADGSPCQSCGIRDLCFSCPGKAFLEKGNMESNLEWFCKLAHLMAGEKYYKPSAKEQAVIDYV